MAGSSSKLPSSPPPLVSHGFSLEPDMLFGWRPNKYKNRPIELTYSEPERPRAKPVVYQGYRASDSFSIHTHYSDASASTYDFNRNDPKLTAVSLISKAMERPYVPVPFQGPLQFDSKFEGGNLDRVCRVGESEFDLYLRSDTNSRGHTHWFYFSVEGCLPEAKLNIVNFSRSSSLYRAGMKIRVWTGEGCWEEAGDSVEFTSHTLASGKHYFRLSFQYSFTGEKVWFATSIPYSYCRLQRLLGYLDSRHMQVTSLARSLAFIDIPLLTVTDSRIASSKKKYVLVTARTHPGETVGSWVLEGFLRFLCSRAPEACALRVGYIFKVVPMVNVDGVIAGNSRTSMAGHDLNRRFRNPDTGLHPEVVAIRRLARRLSNSGRFHLFMDVHGHFDKKGSFVYGPYFPLHTAEYFKTRLIPKLLSASTDVFRYYSSRFKEESTRLGAARLVMAEEFGVMNSYTLENSFYGYFDCERVTHAFTTEKLLSVGEELARALFEADCLLKETTSKLFLKFKEAAQLTPTEKSSCTPSQQDKTTKTPESFTEAEVLYQNRQFTYKNLGEAMDAIRNDAPSGAESSSEVSDTESDEEPQVKLPVGWRVSRASNPRSRAGRLSALAAPVIKARPTTLSRSYQNSVPTHAIQRHRLQPPRHQPLVPHIAAKATSPSPFTSYSLQRRANLKPQGYTRLSSSYDEAADSSKKYFLEGRREAVVSFKAFHPVTSHLQKKAL